MSRPCPTCSCARALTPTVNSVRGMPVSESVCAVASNSVELNCLDLSGCNSGVECLLPKQNVVGSNPITRSTGQLIPTFPYPCGVGRRPNPDRI